MWSFSYAFPAKILILAFILFWAITACSEHSNADAKNKAISLADINSCQMDAPIASADGKRRIALIIGVGQYNNDKFIDLKGPPEDAKRFLKLLTNKNGFQFPEQNICLLLNEQASKKNVINAFEKKLIQYAREDDIIVFYYAGHGSQVTDLNNDEADNMDESLVLHDSRTNGIVDLIDDELNQLLSRLHAKTQHIAVFLDSCHSGTATRGDYIARFAEPLIIKSSATAAVSRGSGDSTPELFSETMPGLVIFTAASDGTSALEKSSRGIFTDAILSTFSAASSTPITYMQASRQIPAQIMATKSPQIPYFQGDLNQFIFSSEHINRPYSWDVTKIDRSTSNNVIHISGPPMPGLGIGSEFRIFPGNTNTKGELDLKTSKGTLVIDHLTGLNAQGHINTMVQGTGKVLVGDFVVLTSPSDKEAMISVSLRDPKAADGIPKAVAAKITQKLADNPQARQVVRLVPDKGDFELSYNNKQQISVIGPENRIRAQFSSAPQVVHNLWQHARQRAMLQLQGEGGKNFVNNQTLQVQLIPAINQDKCSSNSQWQAAPANSEQIIPLCHKWQIKVTYQKSAPEQPKLLIGGVVQSSDGSSIGIPYDGKKIALEPGQSKVFSEIFQGQLPLDTSESVIIFGTQETNPVPWNQLTDISALATRGDARNPLQEKIQRYLTLTRGQVLTGQATTDTTTWTRSIVPMRVEANSRFLQSKNSSSLSDYISREYTIAKFNILPYLPDDENSPLYQVLQTADQLAKSSINDGYPYTQHDWGQDSDKKNLLKGIDCSRSIWYAFTRSGLNYNHKNRYITTSEMVAHDSLMADEFSRCDSEPLQIGDILVYRDDTRGDGHTVMVIDPEKRIAWGSHGWDGSGKALNIAADTGVEYQLIKYKKDWQRWDRKTMFKKACWRYKQFKADTLSYAQSRGYESLKNYCNNRQCL